MTGKERLDEVYQARTSEQLRAAYDRWGQEYDQDLVDGMGWDKPVRVVQALLDQLGPPPRRILELATGTGLVGQALTELSGEPGYSLVGVDFSEGMLERARQRQCYQELIQLDLNQDWPFAEGEFDAAIAVGIFTEGHCGPQPMAGLQRVLRPGSPVAFSLRDDLLGQYQPFWTNLGWSTLCQVHFDGGLEGRPWSAWVCATG